MSRPCSPDEYVAVSRRVAGDLDIDLFDGTTFEVNRLMYWPSTPKDINYYFRKQEGEFLDVDKILDRYIDWKDTSLWPTSGAQIEQVNAHIKKQQDPRVKTNLIGAFCRTYGIEEAIEKFLTDAYTPGIEGRYTYANGSTSSGLIIYDNIFAYSHHGTDPASMQLCNAYDLVRLHKFGHLDEGSKAQGAKESGKAMREFAQADPKVKALIGKEKLNELGEDFEVLTDEPETDEDPNKWMEDLELDRNLNYKSSAKNIKLILENDPRLKDRFKQNAFDKRNYLFGTMPWRRASKDGEVMRNVDYSGIRHSLEYIYGISGHQKIDDALSVQLEKHSFHPIKEYLTSQEWDGEKRVDKLLIDYFGAPDNAYTRQTMRKVLAGAVARVFEPGCKFDMVMVLIGDEGTGKSTFINKLGMQWFSDSFYTVKGKEAFEQVQGCWIIEMAELTGIRKADSETVKHFITKQVDRYRPAFGRVSETLPRQCIFIGTTNEREFLKSSTGNRRFLPIEVIKEFCFKSVWNDLTQVEVDQIWAEAYLLYKNGEKLYMEGEAETTAKRLQKKHLEGDGRVGMIEQYLKRELPQNWDTMDLDARRMYLDGSAKVDDSESLTKRQYVCAAEIFCECFNNGQQELTRWKTKDINELMRLVPGWEIANSTRNFGSYGKQRYYRRKSTA